MRKDVWYHATFHLEFVVAQQGTIHFITRRVLVVSTGLSYLIGTTQANNGTVVDELQKRWKSSYDIVVRPPNSRSVTEDLKLLEPNYMSSLDVESR